MHIPSKLANFAGVQLVPPLLVGAARAALQTQGIDGKMIADNGEVDPQALVALMFDTVEFRSNIAAPIVIDLKRKSDGQVSQLVKDIQPAIIMKGRAGKFEIAPAGMPGEINPNIQSAGTKIGIGVGAALLGLLLIGKAVL